MNFAGFQPSVDIGFQPKEHSAFEPATPKKQGKCEATTAVKSIPRRVAGQPEKSGLSILQLLEVPGKASSAAAGCSPEANDAKNSGAGFQPSVDTGFQPKEHSGIEPAPPKKKRTYVIESFRR